MGVASRKIILFRKIKKWKIAPANLLSLELEKQRQPSLYTTIYKWVPKAKYQYMVNGNKYVGQRISYDKWKLECDSVEDAKTIIKKIESTKNVYFNPKEIDSSVIFVETSKKARSHFATLLIGGLMLVGFSVFVVIFSNA